MPTQAEIARSFGVDRSYITRLVKRGMPIDSFENSRAWKNANTSKRAPTNPVQLAKLVAEEKNDISLTASRPRKRRLREKPRGTAPISADTLADALDSAVQAQKEAWRLLDEAMIEGKDSKIGIRLAVHNKAVDALFTAAREHREELERTRILIPLTEAMDLSRRGYDVVLARLRCLPQNIAPLCNPANAHHAMEILEAECNGIIADAQRVFAANAV
jgi:hypothetical protein